MTTQELRGRLEQHGLRVTGHTAAHMQVWDGRHLVAAIDPRTELTVYLHPAPAGWDPARLLRALAHIQQALVVGHMERRVHLASPLEAMPHPPVCGSRGCHRIGEIRRRRDSAPECVWCNAFRVRRTERRTQAQIRAEARRERQWQERMPCWERELFGIPLGPEGDEAEAAHLAALR